MTFLPIVERELRVAARRKITYRARTSSALVAMFFTGQILFAFNQLGAVGGARAGGAGIFNILAFFAFVYCFGGTLLTADVLSEEKREGTMGFLFLTDLKGYDIVLGKLIAASLVNFYGMLAAFPVLAISLLLGGVTGGQFWKTALALLNTLFFSHAIGIFVSAISRQKNKATSVASALVILFLILVPIAGMGIQSIVPSSSTGAIVLSLSPSTAFVMGGASSGFLRGAPGGIYWVSLLVSHVLAWMWIGLASWFLPRAWQDKVSSAKSLRWRERWKQWCYDNAKVRNAFRKDLLDKNPFTWLISRDLWKAFILRIFFVIGGLVILVFLVIAPTVRSGGIALVVIMIAAHTLIKIFVAAEASRNFDEQKRNGFLEMILSGTPLSVHEILKGQLLALRKLFFKPAICILVADVVMLFLGMFGMEHSNSGALNRTAFVLIVLAMIATFVTEVIALAWFGMWNGISTFKPRQAGGQTVASIIFLPWIACMLIPGFLNLISFLLGGGNLSFSFPFYLGLWFVFVIVTDVIAFRYAQRKLVQEFRFHATRPFNEEPLGLLGRLGYWLGQFVMKGKTARGGKR